MKPRALILTGYGINADEELALAFELAGAEAHRRHLGDVMADPTSIASYSIVGFPGGFSFGDHLGSGRVLSDVVKQALKPELERFVSEGGLVIGICNGFQTLVKLGLAPNLGGGWESEAALLHNERASYLDKWVRVSFNPSSPCVWTEGLAPLDLPIRHGEGRFYAPEPALAEIELRNLVALRYDGENPNGSANSIAGITDPSGRVLGLMPHPEAFPWPEFHPEALSRRITDTGLGMFRNAVARARRG